MAFRALCVLVWAAQHMGMGPYTAVHNDHHLAIQYVGHILLQQQHVLHDFLVVVVVETEAIQEQVGVCVVANLLDGSCKDQNTPSDVGPKEDVHLLERMRENEKCIICAMTSIHCSHWHHLNLPPPPKQVNPTLPDGTALV